MSKRMKADPVMFVWVLLCFSCLVATGQARKAHQGPQAAMVDPETMPSDWKQEYLAGNLLYSSTLLAPETQLLPSVGNGYVSTVVLAPFQYLAGVFNGPQVSLATPSHRAAIPATSGVLVSGVLEEDSNMTFEGMALDLQKAIVTLRVDFDEMVHVEQRWFAHQTLRSILVLEISAKNLVNRTLTLSLNQTFNNNGIYTKSPDFNFTLVNTTSSSGALQAIVGNILVPENGTQVQVAVVFNAIPDTLSVMANTEQVFYFISAFRSTLDSDDPLTAAIQDYENAVSLADTLRDTHIEAWESIWVSGIEVAGNLPLAQAINSSLYYILSSVRADWPWSLSPGGLSSEAYNGHTFWDAESWMYPPLLMLHPDIAAGSVLAYRYNHMQGAEEKAKSYSPPYNGTMFPWESAFSGLEVCPLFAATGQLEQHISGDIALAVKNYWSMTGNLTWLKEVGLPLVTGIAEFWASRMTYNETYGQYVINGVIPPDENAVNVNNSIYTNAVAQLSLLFAVEANSLFGIDSPEEWITLSKNLRFPFDTVRNIHLEYDDYTNDTIKQADVVLLAYPLAWPMTNQVRENDLRFYSSVTESDGPAMTWSIYAIGWLDSGELDQAAVMFNQSYANIHPPFDVWFETPEGGSVNFITGAGGFLQGVINGYGGVRIVSDSQLFEKLQKRAAPPSFFAPAYLSWNPTLPPSVTSLTLRGLNFYGNLLDLSFDGSTMTVGLTAPSPSDAQPLYFFDQNGGVHPIDVTPITASVGLIPASIRAAPGA